MERLFQNMCFVAARLMQGGKGKISSDFLQDVQASRHTLKGGESDFLTVDELTHLSKVDIETVERNELAHMEEVGIDVSLPAAKRMLAYLDQVKNPYCFLCDQTPVKICFTKGGGDLSEKVKTYFMGLKR